MRLQARWAGHRIAWETPTLALVGPRDPARQVLLRDFAASIESGDGGSAVTVWHCDAGAMRLARHRVPSILGRMRRRRAASRFDFDAVIADFGLHRFVDDRFREIDPVSRVTLEILDGLSRGVEVLVVEPGFAVGARARRRLLAILRWVALRGFARIVYPAESVIELEDFADALVVFGHGSVDGPGPWKDLLGRALRSEQAEDFDLSFSVAAVVDYLDEEGRWLRVSVGEQLIYLPFQRLSPGQIGRVGIDAAAVILRTESLPELRQTNQCRGEVCEVGDLCGRLRVGVRLSGSAEVVHAIVEPETQRLLGIRQGTPVWCVFEPAAARWLL